MMNAEYFSLLIFLTVSIFVASAIVLIPFVLSKILGTRNSTEAKLSAYECGFEPDETRPFRFNIKFYIVAMLFVVFDLELIVLLPWALNIVELGGLVFAVMILFITILILGLVYETKKGTIDSLG